MKQKSIWGAAIAGLAAGIVNGLFGGAGGMVLIPLLILLTDIDDDAVFPTSVAVMGPVCALSLLLSTAPLPWRQAMPFLVGGAVGGTAAGIWGRRIPTRWLHFGFGIMLLWGGFRYLC